MPKPLPVTEPNWTAFATAYREELARAVAEHPDDYGFRPENVGNVADRMLHAVQHGTFNHDGRAFKATCKRLGIKYTRTAIVAFVTAPPSTITPEDRRALGIPEDARITVLGTFGPTAGTPREPAGLPDYCPDCPGMIHVPGVQHGPRGAK